ncbi:MAG: signal peptidase I [Gammaproteobacteria bacterium]|nr:signal peptidase I [Gammaproteobacteria bacterium]
MNFDFPAFLVLATLITGVIWLLDALFFANKRRARSDETTPKEPVLVEYSRSFFPIILIVLLLRSFLAEPFRIPSGSMMPTLLVGDFILVNKFAYGIRLPVLNRKVIDVGLPQRGDVVVFRYPQNTAVDYIKRVVGVPGDTISYQNKMLYVNGVPQPQKPLGIYTGTGSGARETGVQRNLEMLSELEHEILVNSRTPDFGFGCQVLARGAITIPEGHYFAMGDNRDNSNDSRCWGLVPEENLVGKAFAIWMNWDGNSPGFPVAWGRLGSTIK